VDLVYVCRDGDNEELRYSIRSAVANLKHDNIWVVGGKPDWYTGNYIYVPQKSSKYENVRANLYAISNSKDISDDFILMNDDFFILSSISRLGVYHAGSLRERIKELLYRHGSSAYITILRNTLKHLKRNGIPNPLNYALHVPFRVNKVKLKPLLELDVSWRTVYGNLYKVGGIEVVSKNNSGKDVKVYMLDGVANEIPKNTMSSKFISSQDNSFELLLPDLEAMFPNPSSYELWYPQSDSN